jgi:hypothetical protein
MKNITHKVFVFIFTVSLLLSQSLSKPAKIHAQVGPPINICTFYDATSTITSFLPAWLTNLLNITHPWYNPVICEFSNKVFDSPDEEIYGERYTYAQVGWIMNSALIHLMYPVFGPDIRDTVTNIFSDSGSSKMKYYAIFGTPGLLLGSIDQMYQEPPASGIKYFQNSLAKLSIVKTASAQFGYGFDNISAVQQLWIASRNLSYLLLVIFLIAAGFMVIFRIKINPQTSVSIQLMIPKIISTLILITFSYAIAGLVIDMVYVVLSLIIGGLSPTVIDNVNGALNFYVDPGFTNIFLYYLFTLGVLTIVLLPTIVGSIVSLVLFIIVLFLLFKIWWLMMKTYIMMILQIVIAPWQIMLGILPGQSGFSGWLRSYIANASVFVVIPLMFLMNMILWATQSGGFSDIVAAMIQFFNWAFTGSSLATNNLFQPGAYNFPELPLFGAHGTLFHLGSGYAILALMPKIAEMVRDALKIPAFKYGSAFGEALGTPLGLAASASSGAAAKFKSGGFVNTAAGWEGIAGSLREASQKVKGL